MPSDWNKFPELTQNRTHCVLHRTGAGWQGITFLITPCMVTHFGFVAKTVLVSHWRFQPLLSSACAVSRRSLCPHHAPSAGGLGKKLEGDTARTAVLNCPKGYSILYKVMLSNKNCGRERKGGFGFQGSCSDTGWTLVCSWEVESDLLCTSCVIVPSSPLFLHLLNHLYLSQQVFLLLFFLVSPQSC